MPNATPSATRTRSLPESFRLRGRLRRLPGAERLEKPATTARAGPTGSSGTSTGPTTWRLALRDARRLAGAILDRYRELDDDDLLVFLSGGKGVHVGIPTASGVPSPRRRFHEIAKRFCPGSRRAGRGRRRWHRSTRRPGSSGRRTPGTRRPGSSSAGSPSTN